MTPERIERATARTWYSVWCVSGSDWSARLGQHLEVAQPEEERRRRRHHPQHDRLDEARELRHPRAVAVDAPDLLLFHLLEELGRVLGAAADEPLVLRRVLLQHLRQPRRVRQRLLHRAAARAHRPGRRRPPSCAASPRS